MVRASAKSLWVDAGPVPEKACPTHSGICTLKWNVNATRSAACNVREASVIGAVGRSRTDRTGRTPSEDQHRARRAAQASETRCGESVIRVRPLPSSSNTNSISVSKLDPSRRVSVVVIRSRCGRSITSKNMTVTVEPGPSMARIRRATPSHAQVAARAHDPCRLGPLVEGQLSVWLREHIEYNLTAGLDNTFEPQLVRHCSSAVRASTYIAKLSKRRSNVLR